MPQHKKLSQLTLRLPESLPRSDADWRAVLSALQNHFNAVASIDVCSGLTKFSDAVNKGYFLGFTRNDDEYPDGTPVFVVGDRSTDRYFEFDGNDLRLGTNTKVEYGDTPVSLAFGVQTGEAADGETVTFDPEFATVPRVVFGQGGKTYSASIGSAADQFTKVQPLNLTTTGFTLKAKITSPGTTTDRSFPFSAVTPGRQYVAVKTLADEATDDDYTVNYTVTVNPYSEAFGTSSVSVRIYTRPAGGSFALRRTRTFYNVDFNARIYNQSDVVTVNGLGANAEVKVEVYATEGNGGSISASNVEYEEGAPAAEESMTTSANKIPWLAIATS